MYIKWCVYCLTNVAINSADVNKLSIYIVIIFISMKH